MRYLRDEKSTPKNPLVIPVVILSIAVAILTGLLLMFMLGNRAVTQTVENQTVSSHKTYVVETEDTGVVDEDFQETPYGKLYYPAQWTDSMVCNVIETDTGCEAVFTGKVADKEVVVFVIYFGESTGNAFPVGTVTTEAGAEISVYAELVDFVYDDTWSQEEIDTICAMQESVNHVIARIEEQMQFTNK